VKRTKTIILFRNRRALSNYVGERIGRLNIGGLTLYITGSELPKEREEIVELFRADYGPTLLLATVDAMTAAFDLGEVDEIVVMERDKCSDAAVKQACARARLRPR
jgi:superfamily II DNA or RNA helicase